MILRLFNGGMAVFMLAPIVLIVWMSFAPGRLFRLPLTEFSLRWYREAFAYPGFLNAFWLSLRLALASGALAVVLSFLAAYGLSRSRFRGKAAIDALFMSPLVVPAVVFGIAMLQFANLVGLYNSFTALLLTHLAIVVPYAVRTIHSSLSAVPIEVEWAAMSLGARRPTMLRRIVLPLAARGVAAAFVLAFLMSFAEVTVTIFMTGPAYPTLPVRIYNYLTDQVDPTVAAISSMLIALSLALVLLLGRFGGLSTLKK